MSALIKIRTKRIHSEDRLLGQLQDNTRDLADQVEVLFTAAKADVVEAAAVAVPIGGILEVGTALAGCPAPGPNFQKLDGGTVNDPRSPLKGDVLDDRTPDTFYIRIW